MARSFTLLVFDWDGTVMDSAARIVAGFQHAIADTDLPPCADQAVSNVIGLGLWEAASHLYPHASEAQLTRLIDRYRHHFRALDTPMPLFEGVATTLETLQQQGYLLAVATGKSRVGLDRALHESGLQNHFHATRSCDETQSKPHPQMLHEILHTLNIAPQHALMIGDTQFDLDMANNAGMASLAVSYGVHERERLLACGPLACLDDLRDLPAWLESAAQAS